MGVILVTCLSPTLDIKLHETGNIPAIVTLAFLKLSLELTNNKHSKTFLNKWKNAFKHVHKNSFQPSFGFKLQLTYFSSITYTLEPVIIQISLGMKETTLTSLPLSSNAHQLEKWIP